MKNSSQYEDGDGELLLMVSYRIMSGLVAEMIQSTGNIGTQWILDLCKGIVKEGCIPEDWKSSMVLPIYKGKGIQWSVDLTEEINCWNTL